jgi:hypothetical protein
LSGDHVLLRNPNNNAVISISSDPGTVIPPNALEDILEYAGMSVDTFWQLYETI